MTTISELGQAEYERAVRESADRRAADDAYWAGINASIEELRDRVRRINETADAILAKIKAGD